MGRVFREDEDKQGNEYSVILSFSAWRKRFGGDPGIIGHTLTVNGKPRTIVGILPSRFRWDVENEVWLPFGFSPDELTKERGNRYLYPVARLRPHVTVAAASRALTQLSAAVRQANPKSYGSAANSWYWTLTPLRDRFVGSARQPLLLLAAAVLFVLLIACANVANLLLARGAARSREIALRSALGASRGRLVRQLLTESAVLAVAGAAAGVAVAVWSLDLLLAAAPESIRQLAEVRVSWALLGIAIGLTVLTTLACGLAPALHAARTDVAEAMKDGAHGTVGAATGRLRGALIVAQVALSLMLLTGAGLLLRSFAGVLQVSAGFIPEGVVAAQVSLSGAAYRENQSRIRYWNEAMRRVLALPGVASAGATNVLPLQGRTDWSFTLEGFEPKTPDATPDDELRRVMPGYFETMRIALRRGRAFTEGDDEKAPYVAMVNEAWARKYFPGQDVIGKRLRFAPGDEPEIPLNAWRTIVGVVADTHDFGLDVPSPAVYYLPQPQLPETEMVVVARTAGPLPPALAAQVRSALAGIDAAQPVDWAQPLVERIESALAPRRFPLQLLAAFAGLALALSALGIYGVTSYLVTQRTREIGVRIAIGAQASDVLRMVMGGAVRLAGAGAAVGLAAALIGSGVLSSQLYGVSARDPLTYAAICLVLGGVVLAASWLPARRATRVDPAVALRAE